MVTTECIENGLRYRAARLCPKCKIGGTAPIHFPLVFLWLEMWQNATKPNLVGKSRLEHTFLQLTVLNQAGGGSPDRFKTDTQHTGRPTTVRVCIAVEADQTLASRRKRRLASAGSAIRRHIWELIVNVNVLVMWETMVNLNNYVDQ